MVFNYIENKCRLSKLLHRVLFPTCRPSVSASNLWVDCEQLTSHMLLLQWICVGRYAVLADGQVNMLAANEHKWEVDQCSTFILKITICNMFF